MTPDNIIELLKGAAVGLVIAAAVLLIYARGRGNTINLFRNLFH